MTQYRKFNLISLYKEKNLPNGYIIKVYRMRKTPFQKKTILKLT